MSLEGRQLGRYRLLSLLGRGAMGEVYLAEDMGVERQIAIKVIRSDLLLNADTETARDAAHLFQREMKTIARLNHPHILPLFDYGEELINDIPLPYMVMPLCPDGSLSSWWREQRNTEPLPALDVALLIRQAADALQYAHDQQVIHRDVKPSNFLIRANKEQPGRPFALLADFGLARLSSSASNVSQNLRGTPTYMAPEQWDKQPVPATDQYALAVMAYQLLTGRPPFQGRIEQVMVQHVTGQAQPPSLINPRLSPALDAVLLRALAKQPEARYPDMSSFAHAFEEAVSRSGSGTEDSNATINSNPAIAPPNAFSSSTAGKEHQEITPTAEATVPPLTAAPGGSPSGPSPHGLNVNVSASRTGFRCSVVVMLGVLLLIVGIVGSSTLFSTSLLQPVARNTTSSVTSTPLPQSTVTAAEATFPTSNATATALATQNPYPPHTGMLVLSDPLNDNSEGYAWDTQPTDFGTCTFANGGYHVAAPQSGTYHSCAARNTNFSNFAYEVSMMIRSGDCGAIIFRGDVPNHHYYLFSVCQDSSFQLRLYTQNGPQTSTLAQGSDSHIIQGSGQTNVIAVVANGPILALYVNHQLLTTVQDSTYGEGQIGLAADNNTGPTEVVFTNARVWQL